jgi:hypothetical protein
LKEHRESHRVDVLDVLGGNDHVASVAERFVGDLAKGGRDARGQFPIHV